MGGAQSSLFTYRCRTCGEQHEGIPDLAFDAPYYYRADEGPEVPASQLIADTCVIGDDHFVRGVLEIPVRGLDRSFAYGVWVSLSPANFGRYVAAPDAASGPHFGWFASRLPGYPDTLNLKTQVYFQGAALRPRIVVEPTSHPLAIEAHQGIDTDRLREILEANFHAV